MSYIASVSGASVSTPADGSVTTAKLATGLNVNLATGSAGSPSATFLGSTTTGLFSPTTDTFGIATAGIEKLRVDSAGRLLLGTTTADTSGNAILQVNGSIKGTITSGTAQNSTSGTNIDFTGIPSWVKRVTVLFNEVSTNGTSLLIVRVGSGSIVATGYQSSSSSLGAAVSTTQDTTGFVMFSSLASNVNSGRMVIDRISGNTWIANHTLKNSTTNTMVGGGSVSLSGTLDRIRITTVNGTDTFDAGSINILWEG